MRIFKDFFEMDKELQREVYHSGVIYQSETYQNKDVSKDEGFRTKELLGYSFLVKEPDWLKFAKYNKLNVDWINAEFEERTNRQKANPGEAWKLREDIWAQFLVEGKFDYSYGERIGDQVEEVVELLKNMPSSRHGMINIYNPEIDNKRREGKFRVPCSIYYHFFIRDGMVQMIYNMRSSDFETHFPYDMVLARRMQELIATRLDRKPGDMIVQLGSFHVFSKDAKEVF